MKVLVIGAISFPLFCFWYYNVLVIGAISLPTVFIGGSRGGRWGWGRGLPEPENRALLGFRGTVYYIIL